MSLRQRRVFLVACVGKKMDAAAPAKDLYVSSWFTLARAYVERQLRPDDRWFILSAMHGLLEPEAAVAPYDQTLATMPALDRRRWAAVVRAQLGEVLAGGDEVVFLAGRLYREDLVGPLGDLGVRVSVPMLGLGIGQQLAWLKARPTLMAGAAVRGGAA